MQEEGGVGFDLLFSDFSNWLDNGASYCAQIWRKEPLEEPKHEIVCLAL